MKTPVVSVSVRVVASGELMLNASVVATLVGSAAAAPPGGGVGGRNTSPFVALTLLVEFNVDSVAAFVVLRHKVIRDSKYDCRRLIVSIFNETFCSEYSPLD